MADTAPLVSSAVELELEALEKRKAELLAKKAEMDAAKAASTPTLRACAVDLHTAACTSDHPSLACTWRIESRDCDDPELCDWSQPQHKRWLGFAQLGLSILRKNGCTIVEPE